MAFARWESLLLIIYYKFKLRKFQKILDIAIFMVLSGKLWVVKD